MDADPKYQEGDALAADAMADDVIISPDTQRENRIPPGQSRTRKWPVLDATGTPALPPADEWSLRIFGLVDNEITLSLAQFADLPRVKVFADFHCVTRWSRLSNVWEGVSTRELANRAAVQSTAKFVVLHAYDHGWTTNLPLEDFMRDDCLLTDLHDGEPISPDHGGPVRAMVPHLYAWKSAKWINGIEFVAQDRPGYWERGGYHNHGDPWVQNSQYEDGERFQP